MKKITVIGQLNAAGIDLLEQQTSIRYEVIETSSEDELCSAVEASHGILVRSATISRRIIESCPDLEIVSRHGVGYDNIDINCLTERNIPLALAIGSNQIAVAEQAMLLILSLAKKIFDYDIAVRHGNFDFREKPISSNIEGKVMLIIGFGRTGRALASRAQAFGIKIYVVDPYVPSGSIIDSGCSPVDSISDILSKVDILTLHCPRTSETTNLITETTLKQMKPSAIVINTARGGIINELDLATALVQGTIAGAGIDVFSQEPPEPEHPLLKLPNVVLSPHCAGVSRESLERMAIISCENIFAAFNGALKPEMVANPEVIKS
ncbi:MAG: hypothetical protein CL398_02970 [Acidiferrobacteraceae bacterium]|nr:hypothetical protein [Acidiferrobacteraceae bacterium]|tara:strand:- start:146 stop:1114 length:969 start_codon:yes stop_codon:yes gene_type:complete